MNPARRVADACLVALPKRASGIDWLGRRGTALWNPAARRRQPLSGRCACWRGAVVGWACGEGENINKQELACSLFGSFALWGDSLFGMGQIGRAREILLLPNAGWPRMALGYGRG